MKVQILGNAVVLTSAVKKEVMVKAQKYNPKLLTLINEEKEPIFVMNTGSCGSINNYGITFDAVSEEGYAQLTDLFDKRLAASERVAAVKEEFGKALLLANKLEKQILAGVTAFEQDLATITIETLDNITGDATE